MLRRHTLIKTITTRLVSSFFVILCTTVQAFPVNPKSEHVELLIDFRLNGQFTGLTEEGLPIYDFGGPGYAPLAILPTAEVTDIIIPQHQVTKLTGAQITFKGEFDDTIVQFSCLKSSCNINIGGSVFTSHSGLELEGRTVNLWGPVIHSPGYDPANGIYPIPMMGCGILTEISGHGEYAGMVGSICFNGVLNFNKNDTGVVSGNSKCTIALHAPTKYIAHE